MDPKRRRVVVCWQSFHPDGQGPFASRHFAAFGGQVEAVGEGVEEGDTFADGADPAALVADALARVADGVGHGVEEAAAEVDGVGQAGVGDVAAGDAPSMGL